MSVGGIPEWAMALRALLALVFVLGLIYLLAAVLKRSGFDKRLLGNRPAEARLAIVETLYLDPRHRLVRVRDGAKEHLLLLGPAGDLVIESGQGETHAP